MALKYENNAYDPSSGNAVAFNVTMDREPIQEGKYEGNSTMKREFSPSPKSSRCNEKIFQILGLLASLFFHAPAWGDMADNGIECSVVMEKASFDPRAVFPDFKLVFANKGEKAVRLFDDFYPLKERGQHREHAPQENRGIHLSFVACPRRESRVFSVSPVVVSR